MARTDHAGVPVGEVLLELQRPVALRVDRVEDRLHLPYMGASLLRNIPPVGPYSRTMSRALWNPLRGGLLRMSEAPL